MNVDFALKLMISRSFKSFICLKWILKNLSTTLLTQFNYLTLPVCPFNSLFKIKDKKQLNNLFYDVYCIRIIWNVIFPLSRHHIHSPQSSINVTKNLIFYVTSRRVKCAWCCLWNFLNRIFKRKSDFWEKNTFLKEIKQRYPQKTWVHSVHPFCRL